MPLLGSSNEYPQNVLWRNTDIYAYMLIYHQMPSLSVSLNQIQKISKIDSIYLFINLFIVPCLFEEKRRDIVFGFPWGVVRGSEFLVGTLSP